MRLVKKIIRKLYHLIWFLSIILFIPNVNAITTVDGAKFTQPAYVAFADNTHGQLTRINTTWESLGSYYRSNDSILTTGSDTYGANWAFYSDTPLVQGHTYALSVLIGMANTYAIVNSTSRARLCIAENITNAIARYNQPGSFPCSTTWASSVNTTATYTDNNLSQFYTVLSYVFTADFTSNGITGSYNSAQSNQSNHTFGGYILEEISSQPLSQSQIQSAVQSSGLATANSVSQVQSSINQIQTDINSSANNIINNNNNNTTNIINNNNQNTDEIINNNNENTDKEIESQTVCSVIDKSLIATNGKRLNQNGLEIDRISSGITSYISVNNTVLKVRQNIDYSDNLYMCFYDINKNLLNCLSESSLSGEIDIPTNAFYARFTILNSTNLPKFDLCKNGNQAISDNLGDLNSNITDETAPTLDLSDLQVSSDTPISDLITMPLTILNTLIQTLDGSCSNYTIPFFYNNTLTFPCFTISDYLGSTVTNYIDLFICFYMCYNIAMLVISVFEDITSLRDIYDSMYVPKHADTGYQPKHAKGGGN